MKVYYNEFEKETASWIRNLSEAGVIPQGVIDERSIRDVLPADVMGYDQCHFFAGVAGWPLALKLAGWPEGEPIWSASCPCQPYSAAGKQRAQNDERHLWPTFFELVKNIKPARIVGEQVDGAIRFGWLDGIQSDLEKEGYEFGAAVLPACSVDTPHRRYRIFWCASLDVAKGQRCGEAGRRFNGQEKRIGSGREADGLAEPKGCGRCERITGNQISQKCTPSCGEKEQLQGGWRNDYWHGGEIDQLAEPEYPRWAETGSGHEVNPGSEFEQGRDIGSMDDTEIEGGRQREQRRNKKLGRPSEEFIYCRDGKYRRIEPSILPLAHGIPRDMGRVRSILEGMGFSAAEVKRMLRRPRSLLALAGRNRVIRLKSYGNAIVPILAAKFIQAFMGYLKEQL
jgi:DNA (cytosine-5)-methyltransferase 1